MMGVVQVCLTLMDRCCMFESASGAISSERAKTPAMTPRPPEKQLPGSGALLKSRSGPQAEHNESMTSVRQYTARKANQMLVVVVSDERMFWSRVPRLSPSPVRSVDTYKGYRFLLPPTTLHILIYGCRRLSIEPAHCFYHIYYQVRVRVQVHDPRLCVTSS
jgi:hypothetical protein